MQLSHPKTPIYAENIVKVTQYSSQICSSTPISQKLTKLFVNKDINFPISAFSEK